MPSLVKYTIVNHVKTIKKQSIEQFTAKKCETLIILFIIELSTEESLLLFVLHSKCNLRFLQSARKYKLNILLIIVYIIFAEEGLALSLAYLSLIIANM